MASSFPAPASFRRTSRTTTCGASGELPEATQHLMLLAAAEPLGDPALVLRAGRRLDIEAGALAPAEAAELLEIGRRVQFRHPLVRSAVYRAAPPAADSGCTKPSPR